MNKLKIISKVLKIMNHPVIFVDMDGVLADYDHGFDGKKPESIPKMWEEVGEKGVSFWVDLKLMPGAKELWNYVKKYDPIILSAYPNPKKNGMKMVKDAIKGKRIWLKENFGEDVAKKAIIKTRAEKSNYAKENTILIDDLIGNIIEFNEAGGKGIHHTSTAKTIEKLKKMGL